MKRCGRCGQLKPKSDFGWKDKTQTRLTSYCRPCVRANSKEHYEANKAAYFRRNRLNRKQIRARNIEKLVAYLKEHPCVDCGMSDVRVLEFDHLRDKTFEISRKLSDLSWEGLLLEIAKCDVVCANCHRRRTARRAGFIRALLAEGL